MAIFWLFLALQDPQHETTPPTAEKMPIVTIQSGNVVDAGGFRISVPPGINLVIDNDALAVYEALGISVPNGKGVFISNQDDHSFHAVLQHYPYQPSVLEPRQPPEFFSDYFSKVHLYYGRPIIGKCTILLPAAFNDDEGSVVIGLSYEGSNQTSAVYYRKVWVTDQEAMVLTLRVSSFDAYLEKEDLLLSLLDAVSHEAAEESPLDIPKESYLTFLGVKAIFQPIDVQGDEGLPMSVKLTSATLLLFAVTLLFFARRRHSQTQATTDDHAADPRALEDSV